MTSVNKATVRRYMDGFRRSDRTEILACLTDEVVWRIPGSFDAYGKPAFGRHIVDEGFVPEPDILVSRLTEEGDIVVAEGTVRTQLIDGTGIYLAFCDVFEMRDGRIASLTS